MNSGAPFGTNHGQPNVQVQRMTGPLMAPPHPSHPQHAQVAPPAQPTHGPGVNPHYNAKAGQWTGWIQLSCGIIAILLGVISLLTQVALGHIGTGLWSGLLFYITTGILGILSGSKRTYDLIVAYLVMSIFSSIVSGVCIIIFCSSAASEYWYNYFAYVPYGLRLTIDLLSMLVALVEFVVAIIGAAFCCSGNCCTPYSSVATRTVVQYSHVHPNAIITTIPQGTVAYTSQAYIQPPCNAPIFNNYMQPVPTQQYQAQPVMPGQPVMHIPPTHPPGMLPGQPPSASAVPRANGGAQPPAEKPPPYVV